MKKNLFIWSATLLIGSLTAGGTCIAIEDDSSLGAQAGAAARELKDKASVNLEVSAAKVKETEQKVAVEAQDAFKTVREQWDQLSKQLQEASQQFQQQARKQWDDFARAFNESKK